MKYDKIAAPATGDFMRLEIGENRIRIVSEPEERYNHFDNATQKSTMCLGKEECPMCQAGDKAKVRFLYRVIDRRDGSLKLLEVGYMVVKQIMGYRLDADYAFADIPDYDMKIVKSGAGLETEYAVICSPRRSELTINEKDLVRVAEPVLSVIEKMREQTRAELGAKVLPTVTVTDEPEMPKVRVEDIPF